jgi:hypothetical protein
MVVEIKQAKKAKKRVKIEAYLKPSWALASTKISFGGIMTILHISIKP